MKRFLTGLNPVSPPNPAFIAVLVIASTLAVHTGLIALGLLPAQASLQAVAVDRLFGIHLWLISFLFSLIVVTLFYSLVVFRRRRGQAGDGEYIEGNTPLEIAWTLMPLAAVIFLAYLGAQSLGETRRVDTTALIVKVISGQWYWQYQYPEYGITSTDLYLPVDRQANLQMTSKDVIHSFWVPEFRLKQDIVPGYTTELRITPTKTGVYTVRCAELCGTSHSYMEGKVVVVSQQEFDQWRAGQAATVKLDPAERGQQLAQRYGCLGCHSTDGSAKLGPTWAKLAGSSVPLENRAPITADREYLVESIINPNLHIVEGFPANVMPSFADTLEQTDIEDIVAYIESLK